MRIQYYILPSLFQATDILTQVFPTVSLWNKIYSMLLRKSRKKVIMNKMSLIASVFHYKLLSAPRYHLTWSGI